MFSGNRSVEHGYYMGKEFWSSIKVENICSYEKLKAPITSFPPIIRYKTLANTILSLY